MKRTAAVAVLFAVLTRPGALLGDSPACRYTFGAETVADNETGLIWQRTVPGSSYTQANAIAYCAGLSLAGQSGWRLPSRLELSSLVDSSRINPSIDPSAFPSTPASIFWSATLYAGGGGNAWFVDFTTGYDDRGSAVSAYRVRCVR